MSQLGTYPPFVLGKPRFDQSTFTGRLKHFLDIVDPRTLFTTKKQLESALQLLEDYRQAKISPGITNEQLWKAQKIKQAIIHPDTGEKIFMPFRMSGYVPFGSVMVVGLLLPNPTFGQMIFWQWMNQSHNAAVNYSNRNASKPTPLSRFLMGYVGAVSAAIGIAVGLSALLKRANNFSAATKSLIQKFVPFPAVAVANVCNLFLMRNNELLEGIEVKNKEGDVVGTSIKAARKAVIETAVTRVVLPAPLLIIPPIILTQLEKMAFWPRIPRLHLPIHAAICTITFGVSLPVAIALFPQQSKISTSKLEPEIREKTTASLLYYNKGL